MAVPNSYGGRGPTEIGVTALYCTVATVLVGLRLWHKTKAPKYANWALIWTMVVWVLGIMQLALLGVSVSYGMGRHHSHLTDDQVALALQWYWAELAIAIVCLGIGKASVVAFLLELQGPTHKKMRIILIAVAIVNGITSFITVFIAMFQCDPPRKLWQSKLPGTCNYRRNALTAYVQSSISAASGFGLALYPIFIVWELQMTKRLKFGICILLGLGVFMGICAIIKAVQLDSIRDSDDSTWVLHNLLMWSSTEMWVTIIIPSIPPLWPVFRQAWQSFTGRFFTPTNTQTPNKSMQLKDLTRGQSYGTEHNAQAEATVRSDFLQYASRSDSREAMIPVDGILMTKDVSVSPYGNSRDSLPRAGRADVAANKYGF